MRTTAANPTASEIVSAQSRVPSWPTIMITTPAASAAAAALPPVSSWRPRCTARSPAQPGTAPPGPATAPARQRPGPYRGTPGLARPGETGGAAAVSTATARLAARTAEAGAPSGREASAPATPPPPRRKWRSRCRRPRNASGPTFPGPRLASRRNMTCILAQLTRRRFTRRGAAAARRPGRSAPRRTRRGRRIRPTGLADARPAGWPHSAPPGAGGQIARHGGDAVRQVRSRRPARRGTAPANAEMQAAVFLEQTAQGHADDSGDHQVPRRAGHGPQHSRIRQRDRGTAPGRLDSRRPREIGQLRPAWSPAAPGRPGTASFAHSTGSLDGTTASEARIIPVPYSLLNTSTPSTPSTSWATRMPDEQADRPPSRRDAQRDGTAFRPRTRRRYRRSAATATSALYQVERSARSFVHSERTTRTWVTGRATVAIGAAGSLRETTGVHRVAPAWYSTLSCVTCMNASSSEACAGVSSKIGRCARHAAVPICSAVTPETRSTSVPSPVTVTRAGQRPAQAHARPACAPARRRSPRGR